MSGTYEPGTIAMVTYHGTESVAIRSVGTGVGNPMWQTGGGYLHPNVVSDVRPLVVLDPDDVEQVKTLRDWLGHLNYYGTIGQLQSSLRQMTKPPKPAEPTGLGAVVEDADGTLWTRFTREYDYDAVWSHETSHRGNTAYADIDAVRVLSQGVNADDD